MAFRSANERPDLTPLSRSKPQLEFPCDCKVASNNVAVAVLHRASRESKAKKIGVALASPVDACFADQICTLAEPVPPEMQPLSARFLFARHCRYKTTEIPVSQSNASPLKIILPNVSQLRRELSLQPIDL